MALNPFNSVGGFSVGEIPANVIDSSRNFTGANANFAGNLRISNANANWGIITDNLFYSNGTPWDFQLPAGNTGQLQFNNGGDFGASANLVFTTANSTLAVTGNIVATNLTLTGNATANLGNAVTVQYLTVTNTANINALNIDQALSGNTANFTGNLSAQNANLGNLATANFVNVASNVITSNLTVNTSLSGNTANFSNGVTANSLTVNLELQANTANFDGNVVMDNWLTVSNVANVGTLRTNNLQYANGANWDLQEAAGANTQIQFNDGSNNFGASANLTFNAATNQLGVTGTANVSGTVTAGNLVTNGYTSGANFMVINSYTGASEGGQLTLAFKGVSGLTGQGNSSWNLDSEASNNFRLFSINSTGTPTTSFTAYSANGDVEFTSNIKAANANITDTAKIYQEQLTSLASTRIVYGNGSSYLVGSANFTFNDATNTMTVAGNANVTTVNTANINSGTSGLSVNSNGYVTSFNAGNGAVTFPGNVIAATFVGNVSGNISGNFTVAGANGDVVYVQNGLAATSNAFNFNSTSNSLTLAANVLATKFLSTDTTLLPPTAGNYAGERLRIYDFGNVSKTNYAIGAEGSYIWTGVDSNSNTVGFKWYGNQTLAATLTGSGNMTLVGDFVARNANLGNFAIANYANINNELVVSGNANVTANVNAGNLVGTLANGNSNVRIATNSNVTVSVAGTSNLATFTSSALIVAGNIQSTTGNMLANGNVTANGFLNSANANITGQAQAGSVLTATINAPTGNLSLNAAGSDQNIVLNPTGNGTVDVGLHRITNVGDPVDPHDATTKEYVDNIAQGLSVHTAVQATSVTNLNATYAPGGTTQTTTAITSGTTITFSANHGLSVGDEIYWTSSFNGIVANNAYFVYSIPALNQITIKDGFNGAQVTTLTNGTGLSQPSRANSGVGATLTNAGANAAIQIDGVSLSSTNRVLVQGQTNQFENGVYTVTTVGNGSTAWVLTRASDANNYDPKSTTGLGYGDYFYVQQGLSYAGSSYVLTTPVGEIIFGVTDIAFTQFSAAASYSAGAGINITGTTISANVDGVTTAIVAGNIVVKSSANLTTPNIGDATFSSLTWNNLSNGNITANNLSISNLANISGNLAVTGTIQGNSTITANGNITGANLNTSGRVVATGNISGNNISGIIRPTAGLGSAGIIFPADPAGGSGDLATIQYYANTGEATILALTVNNDADDTILLNASGGTTINTSLSVTGPANITGNTGVTGNLAVSARTTTNTLTVNNAITGNTANFSGNIVALNANLGNLVTANFFTGTLANGNSNIVVTANGNINLTAGGNTSLVVTANGIDVNGVIIASGDITANAINVTGNVSSNTGVFDLNVEIGATQIVAGNVTTTSVAANQTIASYPVSGVTGAEWFVKGYDSAGAKYIVATVQAVTDGSGVGYAINGPVLLGGSTGTLAVNIVGSNIALQVTPTSSNSTVWQTQFRLI